VAEIEPFDLPALGDGGLRLVGPAATVHVQPTDQQESARRAAWNVYFRTLDSRLISRLIRVAEGASHWRNMPRPRHQFPSNTKGFSLFRHGFPLSYGGLEFKSAGQRPENLSGRASMRWAVPHCAPYPLWKGPPQCFI
jgi:hypothetical protein